MLDNEGNGYSRKENAIYLHRKSTKYTTKLGVLDEVNKTFHMERSRETHVLLIAKSYGFNYELLKKATKFNKVRLEDDCGVYLIPVKVLLQEGSFLHFKKKGFEKQIFVKLEVIERYALEQGVLF
jgi:hypothetical protein